ncbi:hypothetical protein BCV69DRAFT_313930 [Microstroma glucosiphilum]|uniref:Uncharacterized protein n=1 Tax=Pseudomicrostroma glucosiphilum TaxID=1684307 RepID=A0A316U872_9BASI|nr:hypothetical protein BCV69DRAFT_313930 [Pseudomicrostroma glucosiphilum]PWN19175.1 hypothetical protein BCV69DRAFT_313930 [Pseudomicrostroma glucosiphilum]
MDRHEGIYKPGESSKSVNSQSQGGSTPRVGPQHQLSPKSNADNSGVEADSSIVSGRSSGDYSYDDEDDDIPDSELNELETSMRQSQSIDDFARLITEFRQERRRRSLEPRSPQMQRRSQQLEVPNGTPGGSSFLGHLLQNDSRKSRKGDARRRSRTLSQAGSEEGGASPRRSLDVSDAISVASSRRDSWRPSDRCTCCCGLESCERATRATTEWADMEQDLKLAAEIGQALLRRNDVLAETATAQDTRHASQVDSLMRRLTKSIKESDAMSKELEQTSMNLEAADSSNRALLSELEESRRDLAKIKTERARLVAMEERSQKISKWLEDARQEVQVERRKTAAAEARAKRSAEKVASLSESIKQAASASKTEASSMEALMRARARLRQETLDATSESSQAQQDDTLKTLEGLAMENEALQRQVEQTTLLLQVANEEISTMREAEPTRPTHTRTMSRRHRSYGFSDAYRGPSSGATHKTGEGGSEEGDEEVHSRLIHSPQPTTPNMAEELCGEGEELFASQQAARRSLSMPPRAPSRGSAISVPPFENPAADQRYSPRPPHALLLSPNLPHSELPPSGRITPTSSSSEAQRIRAAYMASAAGASSTTSVEETVASASQPSQPRRETRTNQLVTLLDYVQRLVSRLSNADVDTMAKRLQRQHLAGDVGHLSRVTINAITRDAEGMREHFRKLIEAEARSAQATLGKDDVSLHSAGDNAAAVESLVSRKEFFALIKLLRDTLFEAAKLRNAINEVQLAPGNAAKILQEQLGAATPQEDKGMGAWLGGLLRGVAGGAVPASAGSGSAVTAPGTNPAPVVSPGPAPSASAVGAAGSRPALGRAVSRGGSSAPNPGAARPASRASAAVLSSTVAVEYKVTRASSAAPHTHSMDSSGLETHSPQQPSPAPVGGAEARPQVGRAGSGLSKMQSRNLNGLFAGAPADGWAMVNPRLSAVPARYNSQQPATSTLGGMRPMQGVQDIHRPLSRIVDDDEVSIRQSKPAWEGDAAAGGSDDEQSGTKAVVRPKGLRPRGLSDSSIRSTFIDHENDSKNPMDSRNVGLGIASATSKRTSPAARIMNRSTLALQPAAVIDSSASLEAALGKPSSQADPQAQQRTRSGGGGFLAGLGSTLGLTRQPSHSALSRAAATAPTATTALPATASSSKQDMLEIPTPALSSVSAVAVPARPSKERSATGPLLSPYGTSPAAAAMAAAISPSGRSASGSTASSSAVGRETSSDRDRDRERDRDRPLASVLAYSRMMGSGSSKWGGE